MSVHLSWRVAGLQFASLQEPVSRGLDQKLNPKRTCEVYFGRFISAMIPLSQGISPRSVCAQFQKLILFGQSSGRTNVHTNRLSSQVNTASIAPKVARVPH